MNTKCYYAITYPDRTTMKIMLGNIGSSANVRGGLAENRFTRYMKNLYLCLWAEFRVKPKSRCIC